MRLNWANLITVVSVAILVGTELFGAAWASGWALAGYFELGQAFEYGLEAVFGLVALAALGWFVRNALEQEPIRG